MHQPAGARIEVLVIALALVTLACLGGDGAAAGALHDHWVARVRADSKGYVEGAPWTAPDTWHRKGADGAFVLSQLREALALSSARAAHMIGYAFYDCAMQLAGGVTFIPGKAALRRVCVRRARARAPHHPRYFTVSLNGCSR